MFVDIYYYHDTILIPVPVTAQGFLHLTGGFYMMESITEKSIRVEEGGHKKYDQVR